jgi:hypothetical protein
MAVFLFLVAIIGGVVVGDLVLENPTVGDVTVFNQPVNGYSQGWLLAMAAALGFVVAVLLVASVNSTSARRARRKQLRTISSGRQPQVTEPQQEEASLLDAWFGRQPTNGGLGEPARPGDRGREQRADRAKDLKGAQTRSCSLPVLVEQTAEQVASMHSAAVIFA